MHDVNGRLAQSESASAERRQEAEQMAGELAAVRAELERTAAARAEMERIATVLKEHVVLLMGDVKERQAALAAVQQAREADGEAVARMAGQVKQVLAVLDTSRHELAARLSDAERERKRQADEIAALRRLAEETQREASRQRARADQLCHEAAGRMGSAVFGLLNGHGSPLPWRPFRLRRQAVLLKRSGLFDAEWYVRRNPDVAGAGIDPLRHYVEFGAREGRAPNAVLALASGEAEPQAVDETLPGSEAGWKDTGRS